MELTNVQQAVAKFSFTASQVDASTIHVFNKKRQLAAIVKGNTVTQQRRGSQNLCGALVRDAIKAAL
jgi:hypothetical protein